MKSPEVSVMTPVYNGGKYLREMMDSILQQTMQDFEFVIINDGSTDDTEAIIKSYGDPRIKYFANDGNKGIAYSYNRAIESASGEFLAVAEADDVNHPRRLEYQTQYFKANPQVGVLSSRLLEYDGATPAFTECKVAPQPTVELTPAQLRGAPFMGEWGGRHASMMTRKSVMEKHGIRYNARWQYSFDVELLLNLGVLTDGVFLRDQLVLRRLHNENNSRKERKAKKLTSLPSESSQIFAEFLSSHYRVEIGWQKDHDRKIKARKRRARNALALCLLAMLIGIAIGMIL